MKTMYTLAEVERIKQRAVNEARRDTIDLMLMLAAWSMWDVIGATENEIKEMLDTMQYKAVFVAEHRVSVSDIHNMLKEETGIEISYSKERLR